MTAVAIPTAHLPLAILPTIRHLVHNRDGARECQFHWWQEPTILPVIWEGRIQVIRWGSKDRRARLPYGGWIEQEAIESGVLGSVHPVEVVIPATLGYYCGVWYEVQKGIRGVMILSAGVPTVYMLTIPASSYFRGMCQQSPVMPLLVGQAL